MSFDIHLLNFRDGEVIALPTQTVRDAFASNGVHEHGDPVSAELSDGFSLEIWSGGLNEPEGADSVTLAIRSISGSVVQLLFDLVSVPGMTVLLVANPPLPLISDKSVEEHLPDVGGEWAPAAVCGTVEEVEQSVLPLFQGWEDWAYPQDDKPEQIT